MTAIKPSMVYDLSVATLLGNEVLQSIEKKKNCFSVAVWWVSTLVTLIPHLKQAVLCLGFCWWLL